VTLDGVGEWSTATFGQGEETEFDDRPHCLPPFPGLTYSVLTYYCGQSQ
jgi:hypothetical protein